jgi:ABC-type uncharacterized transport system ATPase subunit
MKIEIRNIHKSFGKVHANDGISLTVEAGEILGVLGENGAGKTTLMKILAGLQPFDAGEILVNDKPVQYGSANTALVLGIGMLSQDPLDFPMLTIFDNLYLGMQNGFFIKKTDFRKKVKEMEDRLGFHFDLNDLVGNLSIGERQQLEILRLLLFGSELIILDEPTTGISAQQKKQLFDLLKKLASLGKTVIFVTHKLSEVNDLCQRTVVLRQGKLVGEVALPCGSPALIEMMFGKTIDLESPGNVSEVNPHFEVCNLIIKDVRFYSNPVNLCIRKGEILGLAGMEGSGQKTFLRTLAGLEKPVEGTILDGGIPIRGNSPHTFTKLGIYFMPAARMEEGLVRGLTLEEHFILSLGKDDFFVDRNQSHTVTHSRIEDFAIKGFPQSMAEELSGGNQQRLLLAMLHENARLLLLENPTRGLDIESTNWMWSKLHERCKKGASIIFASADIDELLRFSNRIVVFFGGKISQPFISQEMNSEKLGALIGGEGW